MNIKDNYINIIYIYKYIYLLQNNYRLVTITLFNTKFTVSLLVQDYFVVLNPKITLVLLNQAGQLSELSYIYIIFF